MNEQRLKQKYSNIASCRNCKYDTILWDLKLKNNIPIWEIYSFIEWWLFDNPQRFEKFKNELLERNKNRKVYESQGWTCYQDLKEVEIKGEKQ